MTSVLLMATPFKKEFLGGALLEANAHLNGLIKSPHSFLLSAPVPIKGVAQEEEESFEKNTFANDSLDAWFDRSQTQALIVQKKGRIIVCRQR